MGKKSPFFTNAMQTPDSLLLPKHKKKKKKKGEIFCLSYRCRCNHRLSPSPQPDSQGWKRTGFLEDGVLSA